MSDRRSRSPSSRALRPAELRKAIALGDHARFQAIPGIGKKTAERIVLELREKLGSVSETGLAVVGDMPGHIVARDALVELGYTVVDAERALAEIDPDLPPEERVKLALRSAAHERRSPSARSRGGNHVSPTSPLLLECVGNLPVPHTPPRS